MSLRIWGKEIRFYGTDWVLSRLRVANHQPWQETDTESGQCWHGDSGQTVPEGCRWLEAAEQAGGLRELSLSLSLNNGRILSCGTPAHSHTLTNTEKSHMDLR